MKLNTAGFSIAKVQEKGGGDFLDALSTLNCYHIKVAEYKKGPSRNHTSALEVLQYNN